MVWGKFFLTFLVLLSAHSLVAEISLSPKTTSAFHLINQIVPDSYKNDYATSDLYSKKVEFRSVTSHNLAIAEERCRNIVNRFKQVRVAVIGFVAAGGCWMFYLYLRPEVPVSDDNVQPSLLLQEIRQLQMRMSVLEDKFGQTAPISSTISPPSKGFFGGVKTFLWSVSSATFSFVLQNAASSAIVAAVERFFPFSEFWNFMPSLTWYMQQTTDFYQHCADVDSWIQSKSQTECDRNLLIHSVLLLVRDVESLLGYLRYRLVLLDENGSSDKQIKKFLQDSSFWLQCTTDELVNAAKQIDTKNSRTLLARMQSIIKSCEVVCVG